MQICDALTLDASGLSLSRDGYLVGQARVSKAGNVQRYFGAELGLIGDNATKMFGVYRDPETVFDEDSMLSLAGRPVTRNHPDVLVTAANWKDLAVGHVGGKIARDGDHVVASLAIMDRAAAKEVQDGAKSLSAGYTVDVIADEGMTADGTPYQFRQVGPLRFNHVAYLPDNNPRAGDTRFSDGAPWGFGSNSRPEGHSRKQHGDAEMADTLNVVIGDKAIPLAPAHAQDLKDHLQSLNKALADAQAAHDKALGAKDAEITKLTTERDEAKAAIVTGDALDALAAKRTAVLDAAKRVAPNLDPKGLSDAALRRAAVTAAKGEDAVKDRSDDYVEALFDGLAADAKVDPVRDSFGTPRQTAANDGWDAAFARAGIKTRKEA